MGTNDEKEVTIHIRCIHCGEWFKSGILFGNDETHLSALVRVTGNLQQCSNCLKMIDCNKENIRFEERTNDGRVTYVEGKDTF